MQGADIEAERTFAFHPADPNAARTLSADQIASYNESGFVTGLPVLSQRETQEFRSYIDGLLDAVVNANDGRNSYSINVYHLTCRGLYDMATHPRILDLVQDILGPQFVLWGSHLFAKLPGDGKEVPFHQDAVFWPLTPTRTTTIWLAVDDVDADNAAMQFVPGSHLHGALEHDEIGLDDTRVLTRRLRDMTPWTKHYVNELPAGHVSLHSDLLLHGSAPNVSTRRRAGLTLRYAAADVRLVDGFDDWARKSIHCREGDPTGFWANVPRPEGDRPDLMAKPTGVYAG